MRTLLTLTVLIICLGLAAITGLKWFEGYVQAPGPLASEKIIFIAPGTGARAMATQLQAEGALEEPYAFLALVKLSGQPDKLKAGEYQIPAQISLSALVDQIMQGRVYARNVTIAEGLNGYDVMNILNAADSMQGRIETAPPEGSILPDTYAYIRNDDRAKLLLKMQDAQMRQLDDMWAKRASDLPFTTKEQALALASIVEKETGIGVERARIAGVFVNRLRLGMRLQSDPTVIYAVTKGAFKLDRVLYQHLETDSPYNTYKYAGIPPSPICNPGRAAIEATLNPEKNDFLYFVADGTGGHVFARTIEEHTANVTKWRAIQRSAPQP